MFRPQVARRPARRSTAVGLAAAPRYPGDLHVPVRRKPTIQFSHDFGQVRVHTENALAQSARGRGAQAISSVLGISLPTGLRLLDPTELTILRPVYGSSIDYLKVLLSDASGLAGRPFTMTGPGGMLIINIGTAAYASPGSNPGLLIHEMAHVWQSQHHPIAEQFMINSVESQAAAAVAGGDPYCYIPGKPFYAYAAEQIAESVENGEPAIIAHMAGTTAGMPDPQNIIGLTVPRWETRGAPGVKC
jgi:hypothetical protein